MEVPGISWVLQMDVIFGRLHGATQVRSTQCTSTAVDARPDSAEGEYSGYHVRSETTMYHSNTGLDAFVTAVIISFGLMFLLGPMWWLQFVSDSVKRLGMITGFVLLFTVLLASSTVTKPFESLAATAV